MDKEKLDSIKQQLNNITEGPWKVVESKENGVQIGSTWEHPQLKGSVAVVTLALNVDGSTSIYIDKDNAEFIAAAPENIKQLVEEVDKLTRELNLLKVGDA